MFQDAHLQRPCLLALYQITYQTLPITNVYHDAHTTTSADQLIIGSWRLDRIFSMQNTLLLYWRLRRYPHQTFLCLLPIY
jgi:hypothetical protein